MHARTVQSPAPHAANSFSEAINPGMTKYSIIQPLTVHHPPDPASAKPYRNQLHKLHCSERCCERVSSAHFDCYQSVKYLPSTPCPNKLPQDALIYHLPALKLFGTLVFECQILQTLCIYVLIFILCIIKFDLFNARQLPDSAENYSHQG